jgi:hypothetical protein
VTDGGRANDSDKNIYEEGENIKATILESSEASEVIACTH